jgi:3-hydroxyacyl-[acyl-carrier-protein] dehydratase
MTTALTPHGPSFSFLDSCLILGDGKTARGSKWLDPKMVFFQDHFPGNPLMPGVLLIECAAQASGYLWCSIKKHENRPVYLAQVERFRFSKSVLPDQVIVIESKIIKEFGTLASFETVIKVGQEIVASGSVTMGEASLGSAQK